MKIYGRIALQRHSFETLSTGYWWAVSFAAWEKPRIDLGLGQAAGFTVLRDERASAGITFPAVHFIATRYAVKILLFLWLAFTFYIRFCVNQGSSKLGPPCGVMRPASIFSIMHTTKIKSLLQFPRGSKAKFCGRSLAGIVSSNPTQGMDICLLRFVLSSRDLWSENLI
jgi:hypothetical protein